MKRYLSTAVLVTSLCIGPALAQPVAQFTADVRTGCGSLVVQFTDLSTGSNLTYFWEFGDGKTSVQKNPVNPYTSPGIYTVKLTVTNSGGSHTETKIAYIVVYKLPVPNFTASDTVGCDPFTVTFTDLSTPGDTDIVSWLWSFGDGNSSPQRNPSYTYTSPGSFQVSLLVKDNNGCEKELIVPGYITVNPSPTAFFTASSTQSCTPPITLTFTNGSFGGNLTYLWDFGDGSTADTSRVPAPHVYTTFGSYTITLVATNEFGCTDTATQTVNVDPYTADFVMDDTAGCVAHTVNFADSSTTSTNSWLWSFGDGLFSSTKNPVHTYTSPGTYQVKLIVRNTSLGCSDSITRTVVVYPLPVVDFNWSDSVGCELPFTVNFSDITPGGTSWLWDFGDGNSSTTQNPSHIYNGNGPFNISLTVTDSNGCSNTRTAVDSVYVVEPQANFDGAPKSPITGIVSGCAPFTANFTDLSTSYENIVKWYWNFGDGLTDSVQNPFHTYTDTGRYTVTLVIENADGCLDTLVLTDYVLVGQKPNAMLFTTDTLGCHKYSVQFRDTSSVPVNEWWWEFGDGQTSTDQHPIHIYADTGYFTVTLIAGYNGCYDTVVVDSLIYVWPPHPEILSPAALCDTSVSITFVENSKGADTWFWDFGDGTSYTGQFPPPHKYAAPGSYTVKLVNQNLTFNCKDSAEVTVNVSDITPGFTVDTTAGCQPLIVSFTDTSTSNFPIDSWKWIFGDGDSISTGTPPGFFSGNDTITNDPNDTGTYRNPIHTYANPGLYNVKLIVRNSLGCYDTVEYVNYIDVKALPNAYFTADTTYGCVPLTVNFSDTSAGITGMKTWQWNFGDGNSDTLQNPVHTYVVRGTYTVSLTVTDSNNCASSLTKVSYIIPTFPYPVFTSPPVICSGDSAVMLNSSTGSGLIYIWDYGDGSPPDTAVTGSHTYVVDTTTVFNISLTAIDSNGCDSTLVIPITVSKPVAGFGEDNTIKPCPPFFVNFTDSSSSDVTRWFWDFGNGGNSQTPNASLGVYNLPGVYDVSLIVTNSFGCTDTLIKDSLIWVGGPFATFTFTVDSTGCKNVITFVADTVNTISLTWFFGDGTSDSSGDSVVHIYNPGVYFPVLQIVDSIGCIVNILPSDTVVILPRNVTANFLYTPPDTIYAKDVVLFTDLSAGNPVFWQWDFGDGGTSATQHPGHIFRTPGYYTIMLIADDVDGCPDTVYKVIFINDGIIRVPNVFTPNGDGINDWFLLPNAGLTDFVFTIYNRWGIRIFETTVPEISWNGKTNTGEDVPEGTYYYILRSNSVLKKTYDLHGHITLIR